MFECCQLTCIGGMGAFYNGICATEVLAACDLHAVPRRERAELAADVQYMGRTVSDALNERAKRDA
ncbi:MAG: hypothetical protein ACT4PG_09275 [Panacagrimonas sp.]